MGEKKKRCGHLRTSGLAECFGIRLLRGKERKGKVLAKALQGIKETRHKLLEPGQFHCSYRRNLKKIVWYTVGIISNRFRVPKQAAALSPLHFQSVSLKNFPSFPNSIAPPKDKEIVE